MPFRKTDKVLIPTFFVVPQSSDWMATRRFPIVQSPGDSSRLPENLLEDLCLTWYRYQMLDAFMGLFYTFFTTIAILYGLKAVHSIFKRGWTPVFREGDGHGRCRLEATPQHFYH